MSGVNGLSLGYNEYGKYKYPSSKNNVSDNSFGISESEKEQSNEKVKWKENMDVGMHKKMLEKAAVN